MSFTNRMDFFPHITLLLFLFVSRGLYSWEVKADPCNPLRHEKFHTCFSSFGVIINRRGGYSYFTPSLNMHTRRWSKVRNCAKACAFTCECVGLFMFLSNSVSKGCSTFTVLLRLLHKKSDDK